MTISLPHTFEYFGESGISPFQAMLSTISNTNFIRLEPYTNFRLQMLLSGICSGFKGVKVVGPCRSGFFFFNRLISDISVVLWETTFVISDSTSDPSSMESDKMRVVSLN